MDFGIPPKKQRAESIVPMINVVFLLLIFFLMTAQIAPPEPFILDLPVGGDAPAVETTPILYISAEGALAFEEINGDAVLSRLAQLPKGAPLQIRASAELKGADLATLLPRLAGVGITDIRLVTAAR